MGYLAMQLVHGVDCPVNSAYIDLPQAGVIKRRSMCIFEYDTSESSSSVIAASHQSSRMCVCLGHEAHAMQRRRNVCV